ncbi:MAG: peptide chain release factor N(5)-glutamine methyltransferase [Cellulomonadaceae bacterium]|jgi:release factor glutamine methyltransferase|nr:peptide chain release factor N(5)-glutamine methyltransferase [Cellulomonadaceae bacterium]
MTDAPAVAAMPITTDGPAADDHHVRAVIIEGIARLMDADVPSPAPDAEILLTHVLDVDRAQLTRMRILGHMVPDIAYRDFWHLIAQRAARIPLQHLTGQAPFRNLTLAVGPGVFIPRPETEEVAQAAIDEARRITSEGRSGKATPVVVDLCTGSAAIALAVATEVPESQVYAVELDAAAHAWAHRNVTQAGAENLTLIKADARTALQDLNGQADIVVSNPPYIPPNATPRDPEVADHDPAVALYGLGVDGLEVPRGIAAAAARLLKPGGLFIMEHAEVQAAAARTMLETIVDATHANMTGAHATATTSAFTNIATRNDLTGRPRMVTARRMEH